MAIVERGPEGFLERSEENLLPFYSGAIQYTTTFELRDLPEAEVLLATFDYASPFRQATRISVNGRPYQAVAWEARCIALDRKWLRKGTNELCTLVYTTLVRAFEGQWFDYEEHVYHDVLPAHRDEG